jgi:hypothetical protein
MMDINIEKQIIINQIAQIQDIELIMELKLILSSFPDINLDSQNFEVPEWQKEIVRERLNDNEDFVDAKEMIQELRKKYVFESV